jgi:hypothetical protein
MVMTIAEVLNYWNYIGVFSYVLPFLLIFAVVFAILKKAKILGENPAVDTIVSASVALLALQFDMVPIFFAEIFPKLGIFLAVVLVILILLGFTGIEVGGDKNTWVKWIGVVAAVIVIWWAFSDYLWFGGGLGGYGIFWYNDYIWSLVILGAVIWAVVAVGRSSGSSGGSSE